MKTPRPYNCRHEAFYALGAELNRLHTYRGLLRAGIAVSMHELDDVDIDETEHQVLRIVDRIMNSVKNPSPRALQGHMHQELFDKLELRGNVDDYYRSSNSYIPRVLETGYGIPISLTMIYVCVARALGLEAHGINAPGHFLAQINVDGSPMFVDPFFDGELLTREDAFGRISMAIGRPVVAADQHLQLATHQQWISRMLHNLVNVFAANGRRRDVAAMSEMIELIDLPMF